MLPQFTLNARIIFFMMVMFATATTASLKKSNDVVMMLKNHERALHVNAGGKVTATDISLAQFFSMESVGDIFSDTFKIALYAKEVGRYLCFRRGKLVGMKNLTRDCHFIESLDHGYFLYANAYNPLWRVGFTRGLKPVGPRHWNRPQTLKRACFLFVKINAEHFDRSRFTTTTTAATRIAATKALAAVTLKEGPKLNNSKASIIDSNSNNYRRTKPANNGKRQLQVNGESKSRQWPERGAIEQRHRKRKHHAKQAAGNSNGASGLLQSKNLVRHHHDQGNGSGRRHQHQREERERKLRLKNQRSSQQQAEDSTDSESRSNATNSATPSAAATALAATASLAPSALNIVAMLAAGRRKRGRRKKQVDNSVTNVSSNSGHHQAMDLQLVAQSPLQAQNQYDRVQLDSPPVHKLRHRHEHNYHQTHLPTTAYPLAKEAIRIQQQKHPKYSNNNRDSQLSRDSGSSRSHSHSHSHSRSRSRSSSNGSNSVNSNNLSHNSNLEVNYNNINLNNYNNNNDNINAIPALPKKYLSKNNLKPQTTRSSTDFKATQQFSHPSHSRHPEQHSRSRQDLTSHHYNQLPLKPYQPKQLTVADSGINANDRADDDDNVSDNGNNDNDCYTNDKNSNRLLVNNSNISDNNLQQEQLVNRFKLIYRNRIRSRNCNLKFKLNNSISMKTNYMQKQQIQHYNIKNNYSPISSTTTTTRRRRRREARIRTRRSKITNSNNLKGKQDFSSIKSVKSSSSSSRHNSSSNSSNSSYKNITNISSSSTSSSTFKTSTTRSTYINQSHTRTKRNMKSVNITNDKIYVNAGSKVYNVNNYTNTNATDSSSIIRSRSHSSKTSKYSSYSKNIYTLKHLIFKYNKQVYLNIITPSATAYRHSKMLTVLGEQKLLKQQQIIKPINNPNKYNYKNYNYDGKEFDDEGKINGFQNKYEKIIVQYRSVFNCWETVNPLLEKMKKRK